MVRKLSFFPSVASITNMGLVNGRQTTVDPFHLNVDFKVKARRQRHTWIPRPGSIPTRGNAQHLMITIKAYNFVVQGRVPKSLSLAFY